MICFYFHRRIFWKEGDESLDILNTQEETLLNSWQRLVRIFSTFLLVVGFGWFETEEAAGTEFSSSRSPGQKILFGRGC